MFRRTFSKSLFTLALLVFAATAVFAQNAAVRGRVEMKGSDGKPVPVANAVIDCYRTDISSKMPSAKTDKKGFFSFAGLALGGTFVFSISAPGITPEIYPNVKPGASDDLVIAVTAGDGKVLTEAQVRERLNGAKSVAPTNEMTAEQKKEKEEYDKKVAEITAKNEKAQKTNEAINRLLKEGSDAFNANNFDVAIVKFEEGYQLDPTFPGSALVLLNNKVLALNRRATNSFNQTVALKGDDPKKIELREATKNDLNDSIIACDRALALVKASQTSDPAIQKEYDGNKYKSLLGRKTAYRLLAQTGVDRERGNEALAAFQEYLAVETDPALKTKAELELALTLQDSNLFDLAIVEFQKILETEPTNPDALVGIGLSLVNVGYINIDSDPVKGKQQLQDAANYLQRFVDVAPDTHKYKKDAVDTIAQLKEQQKVQPQKTKTTTTTTTKKKP